MKWQKVPIMENPAPMPERPIMTNEQIRWMIEGAKLTYAKRPYWQEKAKEDVLNALFPEGDLIGLAHRVEFERYEKRQAEPVDTGCPPPRGIITTF